MADEIPWSEQHREYLRLLGVSQLAPELIGKLDLSGVIQVTMLEVFEQASAVPQNDDEKLPWLRRVFLNNLMDELRKLRTQKRDARRERSLAISINESVSRLNLSLVGDQSTPSAQAIRNEQSDRLLRIIATLPPLQREAIELHHLQELPLESISQKMGRPKGAIAALIYRGMKTLRASSAFDDR